MANSVATVVSLQGQAWAKSPDGTQRPLKVGDRVTAEEVVITATDARIELDFGDGKPVAIAGNQEVLMDLNLWTDLAADKQDAAVDSASIEQALTVLNEGGDLTTDLEETAAGLEGGGASEGHSFVELTRVVESTNPSAFNFGATNSDAGTPLNSFASALSVNQAPQVDAQSFTGDEDTIINGQIIATDVENDVLSFSLVGQPANGSITLNPTTGAFVYTPNGNYNGSDSFVVTVTDVNGNGTTTTTTVNLTVTPVNDAPVSSNQNLTTSEDTSVTGQVVATDVEGDALGYSISSTPTSGIVTLNPATGAFVYTPNSNYSGLDSFVVTISDGNGGTTTSAITVGVTAINDAPVSANQNLTTPEDTAVSGNIVATDIDGDTLTYSVTATSTNGTVTIDPVTGNFTYTPNNNYNGSDSFVVTVSDGKGGTTTSQINIGVTPVNDVPVTVNQNLTTPEDTPIAGNVVASDLDGDTLSYAISSTATNGTVTLNTTTGAFVYTPGANYNGPDTFIVTVSDGQGGTTTSTVTIGVTPVNDAPVANNDSITTNEGSAVTVTVRDNDTDAEGNPLTVSTVTQGANGSVVIDAVTGNPIYTPNTNFNGTDSFTYTISDGQGGTSTATVNVTVNAVNDAPVAVADSITVAEGGTATVLVGGATSVLTNDSDVDGDALSAILVAGPTNGTLTLNVNGTFSYTHNGSETTSDSFTYKVNDGTVDGNTVTVTIGVTPVNDAPVANNDSITTNEGSAVTVTVRDNDTDAEGNPLTVSTVTQGANGSVVIDAVTGNPIYTPNTNFNGTDSFTYTISDGQGGTSTATVNVTVNAVNDAPVAVADSITVAEGGTATVLVGGATSVLTNDSDVDGDALSAILVAGPTNGTLTLNVNGTFSYTHNGSETTSDSFTYKVNDGTVDGNTVTVTIGVTPVNDAPVAYDDFYTINEDQQLTLPLPLNALLANDTDADGDSLSVYVIGSPVNGSFTVVGGNVVFTPTANFSGTASFTYGIHDGKGGISQATVHINVLSVNDPTITVADTNTVAEGNSASGNVLTNDVDPDDVLTVTSFEVDGNIYNAGDTAFIGGVGSVTLASTGQYTFTPVDNDYNGSVPTVTYTTNTGASSTLDITVTPVNDAPVANDDSFTIDMNTSLSLPLPLSMLLANDTDIDGDTLSVYVVGSPNNGSYSISGGNLVFTPNPGFTGVASFTYGIHDGHGGISTATVNITVNAVNDAPVAVADSITVSEGGTTTILVGGATSILANDSDADGDPLTAILVTSPVNGTLTLNANGTFSYTHNGSETTSDSFTYKVNDGTVDGNTVTVTIGVTPVNDAPVAVADSITVAEGGTATILVGGATSVLANDSDADGNTLNAILVTGPTNGTLTLNANGTFSYTHNGSETTSDSFTYKVNDGTVDGNTVTVTIGVTPVNDAPQTNAVIVSGNEDNTIAITLSGSDVDGTVTGFVIKSLPANGTLYSDATLTTVIALNGLVNTTTVYFKPNADWNGSTSFNYATQDDLGLVDATPATVSITVNPVADAAIVGSGTGAVKEDTPAQTSASGTLSIIDPDAGEDGFIVQTNIPGTYGSFSINAAGNWSYNLDNSKPGVQALKEGESRTEIFNVASKDGTPTTVTVTVIGTNDGPVAVGDSATIVQGNTLTMTPAQLLANDTDIDGDTLSISTVQGAVNGSVSLVGGNAVFTPTAGYSGPASFTYTITDNKGGSSTATVMVTVVAPNVAPDAVDDPVGTSAYSVAFGDASASDLWTNMDSKGLAVNITGYNTSNVATALYLGTVDGNANTLGVLGSPRAVDGVPNQIEYDVATGKSESIVMTFNGNLNSASFGVSRLFPGESGGEVGLWEAYYNGVLVASKTFRLLGASEAGTFSINTDSIVFNSIKFSALHTNNNTGDGGDYFLTSFSGNGPASVNSSLKVIAGSSNTISAATLLANDTDANNDTLSIQSVQGATHGTVNLVGGNVVFTPSEGYTGPASFTYTISDGHGGTDTATVNILVERLNTAPHTVSDSVAVATNGAVTIPTSTLLANDTDAEGDSFILMSVQSAVNGTVSIVGANVIFTPISNYEGPASFTYTARDVLGATSTATVNVGVGAASAPSVVVSKSLVAIAHGTSGVSMKFPITTKLVDTDGSETLSIKVSNVPTGVGFNAGTNLGGGVWQFTAADLPNLTLNLPGSYTTNATHLTVQVTSTEVNGGFTASTTTVVTLKAGYTTVDVSTTESGSHTGSSASEYISGGNGDNTINGANGNNIINGGGGNDNLSAGSGSDIINGGSGNDTINSGSGSDRISGGSGNDTLIGGDAGENFVDVFVWSLGDQGAAGTPAVDTIQNFSTAAAGSNTTGGDVLDLRDLLQGESVGASNSAGNLANYLHFEVSGGNTTIHISHTGGFSTDSHTVSSGYTGSAETQKIVLSGVDLQSLYSGATTDQQIITQLLNNNKLITD